MSEQGMYVNDGEKAMSVMRYQIVRVPMSLNLLERILHTLTERSKEFEISAEGEDWVIRIG